MKNYKKVALDSLAGNWQLAVGVSFVYLIITGLSSQVYVVGTIFIGLPLLVGMTYFFINLVRQDKPQFDDLFEGIRTNLIENAFTILLMEVYLVLWSFLLIIPGIIKSFSYAMVPFIMADPNYTLKYDEAITESRNMMNGKKMDLFVLYLSFLGWFILSLLTLGIGLLWLVPYINAATSAFYLDITNGYSNGQNQEVQPTEDEEMYTHEKSEKQNGEWDF
jgi:uncharacterized membrane protein